MGHTGHSRRAGRVCAAMVLAGAAALTASGQTLADYAAFPGFKQGQPVLRFPLPPQMTTLYGTGEQVLADQNEERWRPMCFNRAPISAEELTAIRAEHKATVAKGEVIVVDTPRAGRMTNINIVFNLAGSVPAAAVSSFGLAETFLESQFADPITVTVDVTFQNLGGGVIGATSSNFLNNRTYTNTRNGLVNNADPNDTLQAFLPPVPSVGVRYVGTTATVTNETFVDVTWANFKSTIGTVSGADGEMVYNSGFSFDYNPANGITGSQISLVDVIIHEVGHALGFVSAADNQTGGQFEMMDLLRYQRTDGTGDYNPDTTAEFTTTARLVDYNTPNDDANSDTIAAEYRMSDGTPYQASHFREGGANIGIMDPAFAGGETYYPTYFKTSDTDVFDFIGYDMPASGGGGCTTVEITDQPDSQTVCPGANVTLTVVATGTDIEYQWRKNFVNISGATGPSLTINGVTNADQGSYTVSVDNECSSLVLSSAANLVVNTTTSISDQPDSQTVDVGDPVTFTVAASGTSLTYVWKKGVSVISGATGPSYSIPSTTTGDAGTYTVTVTGSCGTVVSSDAVLTVNDEPPPCAADYNADGEFDVLDFLDFFDDFGQCDQMPGPCGAIGNADFNGDTVVDVVDFLDFLDAFGTGC